ncbi:MAG: histidine kinase [Capnocytophaga sp.]|nr:histidine kinase [Capnocytophaga sp.]
MSDTEKKILFPITHILAWVSVFVVPVLIFATEGRPILETLERSAVQLPFYMILFYVNYFWLIKSFLFKKRHWVFILINLFLILLISNLKFEVLFNIPPQGGHPHHGGHHKTPPKGFVYFDFLTNLLPVITAIAIKYAQRFFTLELEQKEMAATRLHAELQHLKYQLQPHFFFNSLNNIYSLIAFDPDKAQKSVHSLSKLMRHFLQKSDEDMISLKEEIDFLNQYIELMMIRLTDKTTVTMDFPKDIPQVQIAPLLLITLVENAFKHGVSATTDTKIHFSLTADEKTIRFESENTLLSKQNTDLYSSSIGIENLRKQLDLIYPNRNTYTITTDNGIYKAVIVITNID